MAYLKGLTRFNYWNCSALLHTEQVFDFTSVSAHRYLSEMYRRAYEAEDAQGIFEYAKADMWAFRAPWVVAQIEVGDARIPPKAVRSFTS